MKIRKVPSRISVVALLIIFTTIGSARTQVGYSSINLREMTDDDKHGVYRVHDQYELLNLEDTWLRFPLYDGHLKYFEANLSVLISMQSHEDALVGFSLRPENSNSNREGWFFFGIHYDQRVTVQYNNGVEWQFPKIAEGAASMTDFNVLKVMSDGRRLTFYHNDTLLYETEPADLVPMRCLISQSDNSRTRILDFSLWELEPKEVTSMRPDSSPNTAKSASEWKVNSVSGGVVNVSRTAVDSPEVGQRVKVYFVIQDIGIEAQKATGTINMVYDESFDVRIDSNSVTGDINVGDFVQLIQ